MLVFPPLCVPLPFLHLQPFPDPPLCVFPVVMAQQLGPVASVLLKLPGMTALARRAAASYQAAVGAELRKYGTLLTLEAEFCARDGLVVLFFVGAWGPMPA